MRIGITTKHITVNEEMKRLIEKKFDRLANFIKNENSRLEIEVIKVTGEHHLKGRVFDVEAKLHMNPGLFKAGRAGESIAQACDKVKEELERQLLKIKEKNQADKRKTRRAVRSMRGKE